MTSRSPLCPAAPRRRGCGRSTDSAQRSPVYSRSIVRSVPAASSSTVASRIHSAWSRSSSWTRSNLTRRSGSNTVRTIRSRFDRVERSDPCPQLDVPRRTAGIGYRRARRGGPSGAMPGSVQRGDLVEDLPLVGAVDAGRDRRAHVNAVDRCRGTLSPATGCRRPARHRDRPARRTPASTARRSRPALR